MEKGTVRRRRLPEGTRVEQTRPIAAVADWMDADLRETICARAEELGFRVTWFESEEEAAAAAEECEVFFGYAPGCLKNARRLRWLCVPFAGIDHFTAPGVVPEGVIVTNSAGAYGPSIAEHVVMVSLMLLRKEYRIFPRMEKRVWLRESSLESLEGRRVVLLGTGDLGKNCARRIRAFNPRSVTGVSRTGRDAGPDFDAVYPAGEADRVLPQAELLIMTLPGTAETENFLSEERMALLPEGAYVVNVGRGRCLDEAALVRNLREGHIAGAALDVMRREPPDASDPLWDAPNLILTPHCAGNMTVRYTRERCANMFLEDLDRYAHHRELKHVVSLKLGY